MRGYKHNARLLVAFLLLAMPGLAQVKVGDNTSLDLTGNLGVGYTGEYGNTQLSDHTLGLNGNADMTGYYYNPNFLNFFVMPIFNRSQENSGTGSLTDSSSIDTGAGIFSGSHFPGSVSFGKVFNSTGNFGLPGLQGFTTDSNSTQFGIGWAELLPGLPPVSFNYSQNSLSSTIFGTSQEDQSRTRTFTVQSNYRLAGWFMNARFTDVGTNTEVPAFLTSGESVDSDESSKTFVASATHKLPMQGSLALGYSYGSFSGADDGSSTSGSDSDYSANASFIPWSRLTTNFGLQYNTNLTGLVEQQLINAGSVTPQVNLGNNASSLSLYNFDTIQIYKGLSGTFNFNRIQQNVYGESLAVDHFSGVVNYHFQKPLWGSFTVYAGVNDQSSDQGHEGTGLVAGVNFNRTVKGFDLDGSFGYSQDVQTILATDVTSEYTYLASARRHFTRHLIWNGHFSGYHTGMGQIVGSSGHSEAYGTNIGYKGYGLGVNYSQSDGTALLTAGGLISTPVTITPVLSGNQFLLVNGKSYGATASATPVKLWTISANYTKAQSSTTANSLYSSNGTEAVTFYTQYQLRKIIVSGGYTRFMQGVSAVSPLPTNYSSFYVGIQRWFHPF